jgi:hypothetical protein
MRSASLAELEHRLRNVAWTPTPLTELMYHVMEAALWPRAVHQREARSLLGYTYSRHAQLLASRQRYAEAKAHAGRALALMPQTPEAEWFGLPAALSYAEGMVGSGGASAPGDAVRYLAPWLAEPLAPGLEEWLLSDIADYLSLDGEVEAALRLCTRSEALQQLTPDYWWTRPLGDYNRGRILLRAGRAHEACALVPDRMVATGTPEQQATAARTWTESWLAVGDHGAARDWLEHLSATVARYPLPQFKAPLAALARHF